MNIAQVRAQYPQYQDLSDKQLADALHAKFYSDIPIQDYYGRIGLAPTTGAFAAGVKSYLPQVQETFGGLKTLLGVGAERVLGEGQISRGLIESGAASMKEAEAKRQPFMTAERGSFTDALDKGVGAVLTEWLPYQAGSGAMQLLESLGLMGAGAVAGSALPGPGTLAGAGTGLVARELAKKGVKEAAEKILKERGEDAAKAYFENEAKKAARKIGGTAALASQAAFYGTGQTTSRAVEEAEKLGGTATDIELARVLPAAAVSTVAEFIGDKIALGALKGLKPGTPGKFVATDLAKNILLNIGLTGTKEVPVEVIQSAAERFGAKLSLTDAQALKEYIDATAASYGMAVAPGVGGGVRQTMAERAKPAVAPEVPPAAPPVAPPAAEVPPVTPEQVRERVEEITGVNRAAPPSAEESVLGRLYKLNDAEAEAAREELTQQRLLRQQEQIDAEAERVAELNRRQGMPSPDRPKLEIEERPSIAEQAPELTPREKLLAKQAEVDQRRLEAGLATGESSLTPGVEPTQTVEEPKPVPKIVDNRPLTERAANNRLLVMRNMLQNQGGDPESLTIVPHPTVEGKFAIQSLDVPTKFTPDLPRTAITRPETPTIIDPVNAYVEIQRRTNTPAARRFVQDFEAGRITREDVERAIEQEQKAGQPQPLTYTSTGEPGIVSAPLSKPRGEREVPKLGEAPPKIETPPEEPPGEEPPTPKATLPQTLQEFEARMPIIMDKAEVREANNEGNFAKLTKALQLSKNPAIRRIGQLGAGIASKVTLRKPGRLGAGVAGVYRYADDSIQVIPDHAGNEHTNAHETLHALISKAQRYPTDRQKPIVADIEKLFAHVKKELKRKGVTAYGLTNVREFTAEAMTNPQFQFELMQLPYPGKKSSWTQFVKLVADLLGIQNTNALTEVMNLVDRLAQTKQPRKTVTDKGLVDESVVEATETPESKSLGGERAQVQASEDQKPDNFLYSVEPTIKSDRLPSYKRGVENLRKRWDKGDISADEFANRVDMLAKQIESAEYLKEFGNQFKGRERGADFIRQRLLEAKRRGDLSAEAVDFAEWFILRNPALVDDLGISIKKPSEEGVGGMYSEMARVMYLMKERGNDQTIVHEILHHLERMMPKDVQTAIRKNWIKSLMEAQKTAGNEAEKTFFANLTDYHFGNGPRAKLDAAIDAIKNGDVEPSFYQYTSPSEFWAVNGSEIMQGRFDAKGALLQRLKRWLSELKEKARGLFGLNSTAPIIRALDSLSKGDGKFVSKTLLDDVRETRQVIEREGAGKEAGEAKSLRDRATADIRKSIGGRNPGEQAISIVNSLGMGVKPPEPGRAEKAMKFLKDAGENPSLTKESAKKTLTKWLDWFETTVFSSDSAFNNKIRRGIISDFKQNPEVLGMLLEASQSQTVHADALASQFMIDGGLQYNDDLKKWESVKKDDNFVALAKKIEDLATKYNVTKDEMERIAHTYFVAKRLPGIIKRNEELDAEIKAERATAKPDRKKIEEWKLLKVKVTQEQIDIVEPGLSLAKTIPELKEVVDIWQGIRKNNIEVMVNSGLWSPEYATAMWDNMDYVPYYREEQLEEGAGPQEFIRGLQVKSAEFKLKGSGAAVNDVFDNMIRWSQYAMNRAIRAHKATQMIDAALKIEVDGKPMATKVTEQKRGMNIVRAFRDGKQELYDMADPLFVPAFSSIQNVSIPTLTFMAKLANVLRQSVVLYPLFSVAQVPQDSFAAMFSSGLKTQHALKIPFLAVKEFIKTLSKTSQTHNELKRFGVVGVRDFSATVIRDDAEIYAGLRPPKGGWGKTKEFLEHIAMSADNAVRQAVYEASMQQGLNKSEALEKAFEIINFRRRGTSKMLNVMGQTVPFFYAYLSAQRVAYRVLSGVGISPSDRKEALTTLATTSAAVAALSVIYAMANGDDEDYAETPAAIRDRTLTIPGSGGVRIPLRPDFFLFPKIVAEHTYLMLSDKGYEDGAKFRKSMADALLSAVASPTPFPTAIKPAIEVAINYDFFQGKPLIGTFEKQKDIERQFRDSTSELAKILSNVPLSYSLEKGKFEGMSPIAIDHMIRGMLGSFGGLVLFGTNQFLHSDPDVPRPEMSANEMLAALPGTSGLLKRPQESALKNDFFVLRDAVEKAANTFNDIKTRSPEGIEAFLEDEKNAIRLGMAKGVDKINRHLSDIRRRMTIITNMPESQMPADEKAENIRELRELEREILRSVNVKELREMAKI